MRMARAIITTPPTIHPTNVQLKLLLSAGTVGVSVIVDVDVSVDAGTDVVVDAVLTVNMPDTVSMPTV